MHTENFTSSNMHSFSLDSVLIFYSTSQYTLGSKFILCFFFFIYLNDFVFFLFSYIRNECFRTCLWRSRMIGKLLMVSAFEGDHWWNCSLLEAMLLLLLLFYFCIYFFFCDDVGWRSWMWLWGFLWHPWIMVSIVCFLRRGLNGSFIGRHVS